MDRPLAIGAVVESMAPAAWIAELLHRLEEHASFALDVVIHDVEPQEPTPIARIGQCQRIANKILFSYIDKPLFKHDPVLPTPLPTGVTTSSATALRSCDVVLNLTPAALPPQWFEADKTPPVWCAHEETLDARVKDALLAKAPMLWINLWAHTASSETASCIASHSLPRQTYSPSDLSRASRFCLPTVFESRLQWLAANVDLSVQETGLPEDTAISVTQEREAIETQAAILASNHFIPELRSGPMTLLNVVQLWWQQTLQRITSRLWYEQWELAIFQHDATTLSLVDQITLTPVHAYTSLPTPDKTWWADPHLCQHEGSAYLFFEEMKVGGARAHLSVARLHEDGQLSNIHEVMKEQYHLSYPFMMTHDGETYMLPETASQRSVTLYKAQQFPDQWQPVKQLLEDVDLADTTVHFHQGRWWMFANSMSHRCVDERDELNIYHAQDLQGPWQAHPLNPVLTGVDRARMAGPIVVENNQLFRLSQYGAHRYGYGVNLNRIDNLSTTAYGETPVRRLVPETGSTWLGCHSITYMNGVTVLDRVRRRRRF